MKLFPTENITIQQITYGQQLIKTSHSDKAIPSQYCNAINCIEKYSSITQASDLSRSRASQSTTERKNSGYSTNEDENDSVEDWEERCNQFMDYGSCMNGALCEFGCHTQEKSFKKALLRMAIMQSFPQLLVVSSVKRTKSFLA